MFFLFPAIQEEDISELYQSLSAYLRAISTQEHLDEKKQNYIETMVKFGKYIDEIWDSVTISNIK